MIQGQGQVRRAVVHVSDAAQDIARGIDTATTLRRQVPDVEVHVIVNGDGEGRAAHGVGA